MIGTKVTCTLWAVQYRFLNDDPPKRIIDPFDRTAPKEPDKYKGGECNVITADPTGSDLCQVAELAVRGKCDPKSEFSLVHVHRIGDITGLARVERRQD